MSLLSIDELRALPPITSEDGAGVYFLWRLEDLLYIGHSRNLPQRIWIHKTTRMGLTDGKQIPFTRDTRIPCAKDEVLPLERQYIKEYKPPFNVQSAK